MDEDQFDLYEGLDNFEDSAHSEPEHVVKAVKLSDDEDDFNLVVDDDDSTPQQKEEKPVKRSKPSIYTRKYRIFFVGAPGATHEARKSNIEFFVLLKNLPLWLDNAGLEEYVAKVTEGALFSKVLYNLNDGKPLGVALVEFADISSCSTFLNHKSHITAVPMPQQVYTHLARNYRHGVVSEALVKSACRVLSVPYASSFCTSQQDMVELEYERQQEELVKSGEYDIACKTFPWFSYELVSIMGSCNRMLGPNDPAKLMGDVFPSPDLVAATLGGRTAHPEAGSSVHLESFLARANDSHASGGKLDGSAGPLSPAHESGGRESDKHDALSRAGSSSRAEWRSPERRRRDDSKRSRVRDHRSRSRSRDRLSSSKDRRSRDRDRSLSREHRSRRERSSEKPGRGSDKRSSSRDKSRKSKKRSRRREKGSRRKSEKRR